MRNKFFSEVFCDLYPDPTELYENVSTMTEAPPRPQPQPPSAVQATIIITNPEDTTGTSTPRIGTQRNFQTALRRDLLQLYNSQCCICGINLPELLRTSHIVPYKTDPSIAADRRNCLLLCPLHDLAFEKGYIGLRDDYSIVINADYTSLLTHPLIIQEITSRDGQVINLPTDSELRPLIDYIRRHRKLNNIRI
jgi:putative restriction endonuclease